MFVTGCIFLSVAIVQQHTGFILVSSFWIVFGAFVAWTNRSLRVEVQVNSLRIKWPVGGETIEWSDISSTWEVNGLGGWREMIAMLRTSWQTLAQGKGVLLELAKKRRLPRWYKRKLIIVEKHEEFMAALEAAGLPVRRLGSDVE